MSHIFSNRHGQSSHVNDRLKATIVAANKYIPTHVALSIPAIREDVTYYKVDLEHHYSRPNTIRNIIHCLDRSMRPTKIRMYDSNFYFFKGTILDSEGKVLLIAAYEREEWLKSPSTGDPIVFYSSTFFTDPKLAPLNRRLQKEILINCYEKGMEVRILTPSIIEANTFAELFEVKKTETLAGLDTYMKTILPTFIYTQGEDTFVEVTRNQEELLSVEEEALLYDSDATISAQPIMSTSGTNYTISSDAVFSGDTPQSWISINATDVPNIFANYPSSSIGSTASAVPSVGILQQMDEQGINFASGSISLGGQAGIQLTRGVDSQGHSTIELIDDTE